MALSVFSRLTNDIPCSPFIISYFATINTFFERYIVLEWPQDLYLYAVRREGGFSYISLCPQNMKIVSEITFQLKPTQEHIAVLDLYVWISTTQTLVLGVGINQAFHFLFR